MAVAYRSDTGSFTANGVTGQQSASFVTTQPSSGDFVISGGAIWNGGASWTETITDNQANSYSAAIRRHQGTQGTSPPWATSEAVAMVHYAMNVTSSGTFTCRWQASASDTEYFTVAGIAFSGVATTGALDVTASDGAASTSKSSQTSGTTATTAQADEVAISALCMSADNTYGPFTTTGWTQYVNNGIPAVPGGIIYKILAATGTQEVTWTYNTTGSASTNQAAVIATFKGATPPVTDGPKLRVVSSPLIWR